MSASAVACGRGRLGQKTKKGWYDYSAGRTPVDDPEVSGVIDAHRAKLGISPRDISPDEILDRLLLPMVNEGFKIVEGARGPRLVCRDDPLSIAHSAHSASLRPPPHTPSSLCAQRASPNASPI